MTLEEAWTDSYFLKATGKTYQELINELKAELKESFDEKLHDELDNINYYLNAKKLIPSINFLKWREGESQVFRLTTKDQVAEIFDLFFSKQKLNIYYDISDDTATSSSAFELLKKDERITSSFYFKELDSMMKTLLPKTDIYKLLCLLAKIADEKGAENPYFNISFPNLNRGLAEKSGNYKRFKPDYKYGKIIILKTEKVDKEEEMKRLLDMSFYDYENELEVLRYKNPETVLKEFNEANFDKKHIRLTKSLSRVPAFDIGAFVEDREECYVAFINLHNLVGHQEFEKICYYAGVLSMMMICLKSWTSTLVKKRKAFVSLLGCYDTRFNFFNYEVGSANVKKGIKDTYEKQHIRFPLQECPCCVYEDWKMKEAFLIAPGFEKYDEEFCQETFFIEENDKDYHLWLDNFKDFAHEDPFKAGRYRMIIPLKIHQNAALLKQEKLFSRLVKAEKLYKQWICGGYANGLFMNYIRMTISPDYSNLDTFKKFLVSHFNLFPCVRILNKFVKHKTLSSKEYEMMTSKIQ